MDKIVQVYHIAMILFRENLNRKLLPVLLSISFLFVLSNSYCTFQAGDATDSLVVDQYISFLFIIFISTLATILFAVSATGDDLEGRYYVNILAAPVERSVYLAGKISGSIFLVLANLAAFLTLYSLSAYFRHGIFPVEIWQAVGLYSVLIVFLGILSACLAIWVNKTSVIMTVNISFFFITILDVIVNFRDKIPFMILSDTSEVVTGILYWILPQVGTLFFYAGALIKDAGMDPDQGLYAVFHLLFYSVAVFTISSLAFKRKDLS